MENLTHHPDWIYLFYDSILKKKIIHSIMFLSRVLLTNKIWNLDSNIDKIFWESSIACKHAIIYEFSSIINRWLEKSKQIWLATSWIYLVLFGLSFRLYMYFLFNNFIFCIFTYLIFFSYIVAMDDKQFFYYLLVWRMYVHIMAMYAAGFFLLKYVLP